MKAIWSTCARAFSLPGTSKKRERGDQVPDLVTPGRKRAKVKQKNNDTQPQDLPHTKTNLTITLREALLEPMTHLNFPSEEREGIFSSLPLTFFSPSIPSTMINQFTSNAGLTLPRLDAMELQYYLKSPLNEDHPFYNVNLIFVTGPEDLLGTVLRERVLIYYDYQWVAKCVEKGGLLDMGQYVVGFPISEAQTASEEGQESKPINDITDPRTSDLHHISIYRPFTSRASSPRSDILFKYAVRTVPPSAFTSESALRDASFKPMTSTSVPKLRAATAPFTRTQLSTPMNEVAGPSRFIDGSETQELGLAFIPFHSSSLRVSSERSVTPLLHIPYQELHQIKVMEFEERMKEFKVLDLEDFYQDLMKCGKDDKMIMELEPGLLG